MKAYLICAAVAGLLGTMSSGASAAPSDYRFRLVADTGSRFSEFYPPAINSGGAVAFTAVQQTGDVGVFEESGGQVRTVLASGAARRSAAINDRGMVVYSRTNYSDGSGGGLFTSMNGKTSTVMSEGLITEWCINRQGDVVFNRNFDFDDNAIFIFNGGRLTRIVESQSGDGPTINASDTVLFNFLQPDDTRLMISVGGQRPTPVLDSNSSPLQNFSHPSLNNWGLLAFTATVDPDGSDDPELINGVYTFYSGKIRTVVDSRGPFNGAYRKVSVNNAGKVAFQGGLDAGGEGIFTGPNPVRDKVVAVGDTLLGSTVTALGFNKHGYNDGGTLVFLARLANGRQVVVRAEPRT